MKNTHQCPKCGEHDILLVPGSAGPYASGNNIMIGMTIFSAVKINRYVCCGCGFTEEWIDPAELSRLKNSQKAIQL